MQVSEDVYFIRTTSSEIIHKKAVQELRELNFKTFRLIALRQLSKELHLKQSVFDREYIYIHYTTDNGSMRKYKYFLDPVFKSFFDKFGGCYGFWCVPPKESSTQVDESAVKKDNVTINIIPHIRAMHAYLTTRKNICTPNIFLNEGLRDKQEQLRLHMKHLLPINFELYDYSVHDCANILKQYLNNMAEPFFLSKYYPAYEQVSKLVRTYNQLESEHIKNQARYASFGRISVPNSELKCLEKKILICIQIIVHLMPLWKRELLKAIVDILKAVDDHRVYNGMDANTLAYIFAPLLVCPRSIPQEVAKSVSRDMSYMISRIIKLGRDIFDIPTNLQTDVWQHTRHLRRKLGLASLMNSYRAPSSSDSEVIRKEIYQEEII